MTIDRSKSKVSWVSVSGADLVRQFVEKGSLSGILPAQSAIYFWRLRLKSNTPPSDGRGLFKHLKRVTELPLGRVDAIRLSRGLYANGFELGGKGLPPETLSTLESMAFNRLDAKFLTVFLADLEARIPALYCGQTGQLSARIVNHLNSKTDFGSMVEHDTDLSWDDLYLEYRVVGNASEDNEDRKRQALEYLATVMTISAFTKRAG